MEEPSELKTADAVAGSKHLCDRCKDVMRKSPTVQLADEQMCTACRKYLQDIREAADNKGFSIGL